MQDSRYSVDNWKPHVQNMKILPYFIARSLTYIKDSLRTIFLQLPEKKEKKTPANSTNLITWSSDWSQHSYSGKLLLQKHFLQRFQPMYLSWRHTGVFNTLRTGLLNYLNACSRGLTFRHRASCILGQEFHCSPENAFYIFNQQIYFIIWYLLYSASLI